MPATSSPFKTILELVLCYGLQSCRRIIPDVINTTFLYLREQKKSLGARSGEQGGCSSTVICLLAKNSLIDSAVWSGTFSWCKTDATQKETATDQQQHSCETLICQRHQTILRFLSVAATASIRWRVRVILMPDLVYRAWVILSGF
jgi:hypothetical protein